MAEVGGEALAKKSFYRGIKRKLKWNFIKLHETTREKNYSNKLYYIQKHRETVWGGERVSRRGSFENFKMNFGNLKEN